MPARWVRVRGGYAAPGIHASGTAPRLEHRTAPQAGSLDDWHSTVAARDATRRGFELDDEDELDLGGHPTVYRRCLWTRAGIPVVSEQWLWLVDGVGHELTGIVAAGDYAAYCDVFESVAETFDPAAGSRTRSA